MIAALTPLLLALAGLAATGAAAQTPLFAAEEPIRIAIKGPVMAIARDAARSEAPRDAELTLAGAAPETHAIRLSARGITRRKRDVCQFPPLRVEFVKPPAAPSPFTGQRRLKLVTHCRAGTSFQQHLLLEHAAYRLLNRLTPLSFRTRLARIDYVGEDGRPTVERLGFFIEDVDDLARRNGFKEAEVGDRVPVAQLSPRDAARAAVFEYLIGNLDWAMQAGPVGAGCCHNFRLVGPGGGVPYTPVPYDFDFSGFVGAPYAVPPPEVPVSSVRTRRYRGFCRHNAEALAAAAEIRARRGELERVLAGVPDLEEKTRGKAAAYLAGFFDQIASDKEVERRLLKTCLS